MAYKENLTAQYQNNYYPRYNRYQHRPSRINTSYLEKKDFYSRFKQRTSFKEKLGIISLIIFLTLLLFLAIKWTIFTDEHGHSHDDGDNDNHSTNSTDLIPLNSTVLHHDHMDHDHGGVLPTQKGMTIRQQKILEIKNSKLFHEKCLKKSITSEDINQYNVIIQDNLEYNVYLYRMASQEEIYHRYYGILSAIGRWGLAKFEDGCVCGSGFVDYDISDFSAVALSGKVLNLKSDFMKILHQKGLKRNKRKGQPSLLGSHDKSMHDSKKSGLRRKQLIRRHLNHSHSHQTTKNQSRIYNNDNKISVDAKKLNDYTSSSTKHQHLHRNSEGEEAIYSHGSQTTCDFHNCEKNAGQIILMYRYCD